MKLANTTGDFDRYCPTYEERVSHLISAGFQHIDLSLYAVKPGDALLSDADWKKNAHALLEYTRRLGADFVQAHSIGFNPLLKDDFWQKGFDATVRSLEICQVLGIPHTVVHAGWKKGLDKDGFFEENRRFYQLLIPYMEETGVSVLTENSTKANMGSHWYIESGEDTRQLAEYVDHPLFHVCWDTGHANIQGNQYENILALGDQLRAVHINDNRGKEDEHILPYFGTVNLDEILHALQDANFRGAFTFECGSALRPSRCWFGNRQSFPEDTRLLEAQCFMQDDLEKLLYHIGEYALKTYGCLET